LSVEAAHDRATLLSPPTALKEPGIEGGWVSVSVASRESSAGCPIIWAEKCDFE
jgi:hypothetical protein